VVLRHLQENFRPHEPLPYNTCPFVGWHFLTSTWKSTYSVKLPPILLNDLPIEVDVEPPMARAALGRGKTKRGVPGQAPSQASNLCIQPPTSQVVGGSGERAGWLVPPLQDAGPSQYMEAEGTVGGNQRCGACGRSGHNKRNKAVCRGRLSDPSNDWMYRM
jgi:hypothetical protein